MPQKIRNNVEVSTAGFILVLIGGILNISSIFSLIFPFIRINTSFIFPLFSIIFSIYSVIIGIVTIIAAFLMKNYETLKKGSILALILGILSLNIITILGAILGLAKISEIENRNKLKRDEKKEDSSIILKIVGINFLIFVMYIIPIAVMWFSGNKDLLNLTIYILILAPILQFLTNVILGIIYLIKSETMKGVAFFISATLTILLSPLVLSGAWLLIWGF